jgi:acyl dehydratase
MIPVGVTTNEPGSFVHLVIAYNAFPYYTSGQAQQTDAAGNATITWHVHVAPLVTGATVTAQVSVVAQDKRGMYVTSPQTTVHITTKTS